jgi:hypothetical protein
VLSQRIRQETTPNRKNAGSPFSWYRSTSRRTSTDRKRGLAYYLVVVSFSSFTQVVEILFARGLVKVLFATETFAMVPFIPLSINLNALFIYQLIGSQHANEMCSLLRYP